MGSSLARSSEVFPHSGRPGRVRCVCPPNTGDRDSDQYLQARGCIPFGPRKWIDPVSFEKDGFLAEVLSAVDGLSIELQRDEEALRNTLEWQRSSLLGVLSARKKGPIPLEQQRAALLFSLQQRAIRLIEDRDLV